MLRDEEWHQEDGLMLKERKVYVPKDEKLKAEVIRLHHDMPVGGHVSQTSFGHNSTDTCTIPTV